MPWRLELFGWLRRQMIMVEDWPYAGTDFTGDPDLPLPEGDDWDEELGVTLFFDFYVFVIIFVIHVHSNNIFYVYVDVGPERPAGMSPIARRTPLAHDPQAEGAEGGELIQNLEGIA